MGYVGVNILGMGLGVELEGLSDTGVFVSELSEGGQGAELLQVGDEILEVNGQSIGEIYTNLLGSCNGENVVDCLGTHQGSF